MQLFALLSFGNTTLSNVSSQIVVLELFYNILDPIQSLSLNTIEIMTSSTEYKILNLTTRLRESSSYNSIR